MQRSTIREVAAALCVLVTCANAALRFSPQRSNLGLEEYIDPLPSSWDIRTTQNVIQNNLNSWWSTSFVTGSDNHQYLIVSNVGVLAIGFGFSRASMFDITAGDYFRQFTNIGDLSSLFNSTVASGFHIDLGNYGFSTTTADPMGPVNTWSTNAEVSFNITAELSAPILLDAGTGTFEWQVGLTNEWSMPAGYTTGSFKKNDTEIIINPKKSMTWYDRQWGPVYASNFTWFQIHLHNGNVLSTWFFPSATNTTKGFATVGDQAGIQKVIPATYAETGRYWTSPDTNFTYPLDWTIGLLHGDTYYISSVYAQQETFDPSAYACVYDGVVTISAMRNGTKEEVGFGMVERLPVPDHAGPTRK